MAVHQEDPARLLDQIDDQIDFTPAALPADLAGRRVFAERVETLQASGVEPTEE